MGISTATICSWRDFRELYLLFNPVACFTLELQVSHLKALMDPIYRLLPSSMTHMQYQITLLLPHADSEYDLPDVAHS